jgi:drug/metabolite transporter (DMT)-like permease
VLPFVILLHKERVSPRAAVGAALAVGGVAILMLW